MTQQSATQFDEALEVPVVIEEAAPPAGRTPALRRLVVGLMLAPMLALLLVNSRIPLGTRTIAGIFWILCLLPAWFYLGIPVEKRRPIPLLPFIGILYGLYYPLSVVLGSFNEYYKITVLPETDYLTPVALGLLGWVFLLVGYLAIQASAIAKIRAWGEEWDSEVVRKWAVRLVVMGVMVEAVRRTIGIPIIIGGLATFVASLAQFGIGLLAYLLLRTGLSAFSKLVLATGMLSEFVLALTSGLISEVLRLILLLIFVVWVARQTLSMRWIWLTLVGMCALLAVKGVTLEFRRTAWVGNGIGTVERIDLLRQLVGQQIEEKGFTEVIASGAQAVSIRSALTDLFADVTRRTPAQVGYWEGHTYLHLVGAFIPRFIWPDKPQHHVGNDFGHRYGYIDWFDMRTSWNLPVMVEFYVNFGEAAVIVGMFIVGVLYGLFCALVNRNGQSPLVSLAALVLSMTLINIESDFSLMFGALFMQGTALWLVLRMIARDSRRAKLRKAMSGEILNSGDWVTA